MVLNLKFYVILWVSLILYTSLYHHCNNVNMLSGKSYEMNRKGFQTRLPAKFPGFFYYCL